MLWFATSETSPFFPSKELRDMKHISFHVLSRVRKHFSSNGVQLRSQGWQHIYLDRLFTGRRSVPAIRQRCEFINCKCAVTVSFGARRGVERLARRSVAPQKQDEGRVDGKDGVSLLWFTGSPPGSTIRRYTAGFKTLFKEIRAKAYPTRDTLCISRYNHPLKDFPGMNMEQCERMRGTDQERVLYESHTAALHNSLIDQNFMTT